MTKNLHLDWGHCQRSVIKLVEDGFMTREKQGRSYHLGLTPAGEKAFRTCHQVFFDWDAQNLSGLTEEEQHQFPEPAAKGSTDEKRKCVTCTTPS